MKEVEKISIKLNSLDDAYSRFSTSEDKSLDNELSSYVLDRADDVSIKSNLEINVELGNRQTEEEKKLFVNVFRNHFAKRVKEEKRNTLKKYIISGLMILMGVLLAFIFRIIPDKFFMFEFIVEIGAWVFIWEAVYVLAFNIPFSHTKNIYYKKLMNIEIKFEENITKRREKRKTPLN